jgi:hypothetical protein
MASRTERRIRSTLEALFMDAFDAYPPPPPPRSRGRRWTLPDALRDPRHRLTLLAGAALLILLVVATAWYASPTNRARRALAAANQKIIDKQHEVIDARRMLAQRIAELRAAQAEAQVEVTRYQGALDRATRSSQLDSVTAAGDVLAGDTLIGPGAPDVPPSASRPRP